VYDRLCEHARIAVEDADDLVAVESATSAHVVDSRIMAAARVIEASELYRLTAHALDFDVSPTPGRVG
jgi:hypothetical protein